MRLRMITGTLPAIALASAASGGLAACGSSPAVDATGKVEVVTAFYPLQEAVSKVGGDLVSVTDLTPPGVEPHDLELTADQIQAIARADVVFYLGGGFQPAVEDALGDANGTVVDVSANVRTLPVPPGESDTLTADPHVWLDPERFRAIVGEIADTLSGIRPADASTFRANASAEGSALATLNAEYRSGLANCPRDEIVTSHAAFGYLASRYGLRQEPISGLQPDAEPTPQHLAELKALVERDGITTIFTEELVSPKVAETLAQETGATTAVLNPLESLTPDEVAAGDDYASVMRQNLTELRSALGCS